MSSNGAGYNLTQIINDLQGLGSFGGVDFSGKQSMNSTFGESIIGGRFDDYRIQFQYDVSEYDISSKQSGTSTDITNNDSRAVLETVDDTSGYTYMSSNKSIRYRPGHMTDALFTGVFKGARTGITQILGLYDEEDALAFGTKDGIFGIFYYRGDEEQLFIPQSEFSEDDLTGLNGSVEAIDITKMNLFMIQFGWLGIAPIVFSLFISGRWVTCHVIDNVNKTDKPTLRNPSLPMAMYLEQDGTEPYEYAAILSSSWRGGSIAIEQGRDPGARLFSHTNLDVSIDANVSTAIYFIKPRELFHGKKNHISSQIIKGQFVNTGNKTAVFEMFRKSSLNLESEPTYTNLNTELSTLAISKTPINTLTEPEPSHSLGTVIVEKDGSVIVDFYNEEYMIHPEDEIVFVGRSTNATTLDIVVNIQENF